MEQGDAIYEIRQCAAMAQRLIRELHERDPENETFSQVGLLDGEETIIDYLSHNEWGIAFEHLLYMIHESDIGFDMGRVERLHRIAEHFRIKNHYTRSNLSKLGTLSTAFNIPPP
jgi:hypothetical protein